MMNDLESKSKILLKEITDSRTSFQSEEYSMSVGELVNLYKDEEIIIRPEYQRLFRWEEKQKVRLIESFLLGIPIPPIFVYQDENGKWELVDGLQRVSTILQLFGTLRTNTNELVLTATKYLPHLDGYTWSTLPQPLKLQIKRSKITVKIILSTSDRRAKFEVFQRLNTGGSQASNQEIRNNIMVMVDRDKYVWFEQLSNFEPFRNTISLTERQEGEQYHMELLLRFIALLNNDYDPKKDVGEFLDDVNEDLLKIDEIEKQRLTTVIHSTFSLLNAILGADAFKKYRSDREKFGGKFLESAFEAITVGVATNIDQYCIDDEGDRNNLLDKIKNIYTESGYDQAAGAGKNARSRIPKLLPFAKDYFRK